MRVGLIRLEVGVTDNGLYCTTYLTEVASELKDSDPDFKILLDELAASSAKVLNTYGGVEGGKATGYGPGAEAIRKALKEDGVDVEVLDIMDVDKPAAPPDTVH